jgi:hypothetical protein
MPLRKGVMGIVVEPEEEKAPEDEVSAKEI